MVLDEDILTGNPFHIIKAAANTLKPLIETEAQLLPFSGGIIAYFSYDSGNSILNISQQLPNDCQLPTMVASEYPWAIVQDHQKQKCFFIAHTDCDQQRIDIVFSKLQETSNSYDSPFVINNLESNTRQTDYYQKIAQIHDYIRAGDCYQVNLSQCFSSTYQGDPYIAYKQLRSTMASPFSAFLDIGDQQSILSLSPERFIQAQQNTVLMQPIKGTIARDHNATRDNENAQTLKSCSKNRAENLMIVDLLRNDLGRNCKPGSIKVPALFELESFPNVHHLVSSITGEIANGKTPLDVFESCFPGGSITGAPKIRAMEIIGELENCQRSIYCGSIVYINNNGNLDSNIAIRTIACDGKKLYCWGGGGIVADSQASDEYDESLMKIDTILQVLNQFRCE
ncbi:MAG: aminodeoxychorismate synthase component I [marine bacterium B5-7]|nr:MAG: aminodeoxychorismate synthase component I [marine bacterium B5-7]